MSRAMWTGMLSFGLVSIPVGLHSATEEHELEFHRFERDTSDRIRDKRVNEHTGQEVPFARIVKDVDVGGGELVIVSREELEQVAPGRSRMLSIVQFVTWARSTRCTSRRPAWRRRGTDRPSPIGCCSRRWRAPIGPPSPRS